jgi:mRNA-degrading endonuclease RelE of RelBE toxin-antitoxin system
MKYEFKPSFDRSVKSLAPKEKQQIKDLCINLIDVLSGDRELFSGMGLKNLRKTFWEIRKGLKLRILFKWRADHVEFVLAETYEDIKKYLKR